VIAALYRASQAGVKIDLLVRGICCLRPGLPGVSESIQVLSVVDRFLEHARIFFFEAGGKREVYLSSADWMPRNLIRRVEVMFPIDEPALRERVLNEILLTSLSDNLKAWRLLPDGHYERVRPSTPEEALRSQKRFMDLARQRSDAPMLPLPGGSQLVRARPAAAPPTRTDLAS
jgi:polyphosphate kinase